MNVKSIKLMTNNPRKIEEMTKLGIQIDGRIQCLVEGNEHSSGYLEAKMDRMSHMMDHLE
jgi:GTP cyclohydrolase II